MISTVAWLGCQTGLFEYTDIQILLISWYFHAPQSLEFTQINAKYKKQPVSISFVGGNALLMREGIGELLDWFMLPERLW